MAFRNAMFYLLTPLAGKDLFENQFTGGAVMMLLRWPACVGYNVASV